LWVGIGSVEYFIRKHLFTVFNTTQYANTE
jgi:hypothetical protein